MALKAKAPKVEANHVKKSANDLLFTGQNEVIMYVLWSLIISCFCACCWRGFTHRGSNRRQRQKLLTKTRKTKVEREEEDLELELERAESKLAAKRLQRQVITARVERDNIESELTELQDEKGRSLYGDAWDNPQDDSVPIKELFSLNEDELREIKIEAYNRMARDEKERNGGRGTIQSARLKSTIADYRTASSGTTPAERNNSILLSSRIEDFNKVNEREEEVPLIVTADTTTKTKRSMKPNAQAPYDDPRFVRPRPSNSHNRLVQGPGATNHLSSQIKPSGVYMQSPELINPLPPQIPPPSAHHGNIWMQKPGLSNPLPPKLPPPAMNTSEWRQRTPRLLSERSTPEYKVDDVDDNDEESALLTRRSRTKVKKATVRRNSMV